MSAGRYTTKTPADILAASREPKRRKRSTSQRGPWDCGIRSQREALGLTLDEVADAVKMSKTALWQIEHGSDPMLTTAMKLSEFFGWEIGNLWKAHVEGEA